MLNVQNKNRKVGVLHNSITNMVSQRVDKKMRMKQNVLAAYSLAQSIDDRNQGELAALQESKAQTISRLLNEDPEVVVHEDNSAIDSDQMQETLGSDVDEVDTAEHSAIGKKFMAGLSLKQANSIDGRSRYISKLRETVMLTVGDLASNKKEKNADLKAYGTLPL